MRAGRIAFFGLLGGLATFWAASCQGPQEFFRDNPLGMGTGGVVSTGGQGQSTGGAPGTGGTVITGSGGTGTGGVVSTGGVPGTGGHATGGVTGTGGIVATGGVPGTGGVKATGGVPGTGGIAATGGVTGTGGVAATGGVTGTGGVTATGGATGSAGSSGTAKNCVDAIKLAGYSAGGQACSACKENGADKSVPCKAVIDCLDTNYPCGSANNCALQCNNSGGADSIVSGCVTMLLSAAACM